MVTEEQDRKAEEVHIQQALSRCGYPDWSIRRAKLELRTKQGKTNKKKSRPKQHDHKTPMMIPYVEGVSEAVARVYSRYGISTAMRPHMTIWNLLVHPKDKVTTEKKTAECIYRIPCKNFLRVYIGETERSFGIRIKEHRKEVEAQEGQKYTRNTRKQSLTEHNKSAITDHVNAENHVINWDKATVIGCESDRTAQWIREAIKIRQESQGFMNRDEGAYQLSHVYDYLLLSATTSVVTPGGEFTVRKRQQQLPKCH